MVFTVNDARELSPVFKGAFGNALFEAFAKLTGLDKVNMTNYRVEKAGITPGPDFAKGILDDGGIDFLIGNPQRLFSLPDGPFITISNHVYGHADGICLVDLIGHARPGAKVMVNDVLMRLRGLAPSFISVNPTVTKRETTAKSISGIRSALMQLASGNPLCLFPSGAVADLKPRKGWILEEREWQDAAVKLIRKAHVPVVPIRFFDRNSYFYYLLGLIDYRVRLLRLCHEFYNKKGKVMRVGIGPVITPEEQDAVPDSDFKAFLRGSVYDMPMPEEFTKRSDLWK